MQFGTERASRLAPIHHNCVGDEKSQTKAICRRQFGNAAVKCHEKRCPIAQAGLALQRRQFPYR
jgi:hypothetical protein